MSRYIEKIIYLEKLGHLIIWNGEYLTFESAPKELLTNTLYLWNTTPVSPLLQEKKYDSVLFTGRRYCLGERWFCYSPSKWWWLDWRIFSFKLQVCLFTSSQFKLKVQRVLIFIVRVFVWWQSWSNRFLHFLAAHPHALVLTDLAQVLWYAQHQ